MVDIVKTMRAGARKVKVSTRLGMQGRPFRSLAKAVAHSVLATRDQVFAPYVDQGTSAEGAFWEHAGKLTTGTIIELGTRRVDSTPSTVRRHRVQSGVRYIASDFQAGVDVDVVADAEQLSQTFEPGSIDAVIACSVFEHIRKPWLAAAEIGKVLKPGGFAYVQTHNCFPIHAYPYDYWRFTREALETLFSDEVGFTDQKSWYDFPAAIVSPREPLTAAHENFLNVSIVAQRAMDQR
jgi:SAM-dependent methyltransferase